MTGRRGRFARLRALLLATLIAGFWGAHAGAQELIDSVDELEAAVRDGGEYLIEPGTYEVEAPLVIERDLVLRGAGAEATEIRVASGPFAVRIEAGAAVRFEGLAISHAGEQPSDVVRIHDASLELLDVRVAPGRVGESDDPARPYGLGAGLVLTGAARLDVEGGIFDGQPLAAIEAYDRAVATLRGTEFASNATGVFAEGHTQVEVVDAAFHGHDRNALMARGRATVVITRTSFVGDGAVERGDAEGYDAVHFGGEAVVELVDVTFSANPRFALSIADAAQVRSVQGRFEGNGGVPDDIDAFYSAILVAGAGRLSLTGDVLLANPGGAIELTDAAVADLVDVTVEATGTWAHTWAGGGARLSVVGGHMIGNEGAIYVGEGARAELTDVTIENGAAEGVLVDGGGRVDLTGVVVRGHPAFGLELLGGSQATVTGGRFEANRSGMVAMGASHLVVTDVDVTDHERTGIAFLHTSSGEAVGNRVGANGWNGIVVADDAEARLVDNRLDGNGERGILFDGRGRGAVHGNTVSDSPVGVSVVGDATPELGDGVFENVDVEVERR